MNERPSKAEGSTANYYALMVRAVAGTDSDVSRRLIYERARSAQLEQLRKLEPPLGEIEITRERLSLEEAISRLESELAGVLSVEAQLNQPSKGNPRKLQFELEPAATKKNENLEESGH